MKTKQEVIQFLESKVGTKVKCVGNASLDGMCVTLIKAVMEFIGVPDPYKARGHAKTCISAYINEGIAKQGTGFLTVFSNKNMGAGYGHVWCNAGDGNGEFYESNGVKALTVTKGKTYSYDMVCNFDQYITDNTYRGYDLTNKDSMKVTVDDHIRVVEGQLVDKSQYEAIKGQLSEVKTQNDNLSSELGAVRGELATAIQKIDSQNKVIASFVNEDAIQLETLKRLERESGEYKDRYFNILNNVQETLKQQQTMDGTVEAEKLALESVHSLVGRVKDLEDELTDERGRIYDREATITKLTKQLEQARKPLSKYTTMQLIRYIISRGK